MNSGNAENGENLQSKYEFNSRWADRIARLILLGLAVDILAAFVLGKSALEIALTIVANALILSGVWGELLFEKRAKEAADGIVAQANARAAEAQLELAKFRTPRVKLLTSEARAVLLKRLRPFPGTIFIVGHDNLDREVWDFLWVLEPIIRDAGWIHADWQGGQTFKKQHWPGNHWYGVAGVMNVSIEPRLSGTLDVVDPVAKAATALTEALREVGIEAVMAPPNNSSIQTNVVTLLVGPKR